MSLPRSGRPEARPTTARAAAPVPPDPTRPLQPARVLLHTAFAALPLAYALLDVPRDAMLTLALALAVPYLGLDGARLAWPGLNRLAFASFAPLLRPREARRLTGASYSLLALVVAVWAFAPAVVAAAFLYHSVGDSAAGWVGRRWGRHRLGRKSLEGTAAFVVAGSVVTWPFVGVTPAIVGAALAGAVELGLPVDDNLAVPLAGGGSLALLARATGG